MTVTTQQLSDLQSIKIKFKDGAPVPNELEMDMILELSASHNTEGEPIRDRSKIRGFGRGEPQPATLTINGHYTSYRTKTLPGGPPISPRDFMSGKFPGATSKPTNGSKFHFDVIIEIIDPSAQNTQNERLTYNDCEVTGIEFAAEVGSNKLNFSIRSSDVEPESEFF